VTGSAEGLLAGRVRTAEEAVRLIEPGSRVFVGTACATPRTLVTALESLEVPPAGVTLVHALTDRVGRVDRHGRLRTGFRHRVFYVGSDVRDLLPAELVDYVPVSLADVPAMFTDGHLPLDVALVQVSPPDKHGYCSLGPSVDIARTAVNTAKYVIAQVNPQVPRTHGDSLVHSTRFHSVVLHEEPIHEANFGEKVTDIERQIGRNIAELVDDRSTLQMGIGAIPDAVLSSLTNHKDLGVHTEMFSDGLIPLFESDVINNKYKAIHPNRTVAGFALGSRALYDYVDDNPAFAFLDIDYVNEPGVIRRNPRVVAINAAIEVDITGQVCADSIGTYQYSGVGGQMDFMRGAALSEGGKPIIALTSRTAKGVPRIVPFLKPGAGVVTTRAHVHYVVTEYGSAFLFGKNLRQRAKALIDIAHPDDREALERACHERFHEF